MSAEAAAAELLKNPQFLELFQKTMGDEKIPDEKDPKREEWLKQLQEKLYQESVNEKMKELEKPVKDEEGEWMWVAPEPGFCIKCNSVDGREKVFINICKHPKIAEPIPIDDPDNDTVQFKIPLSCGSARPDKDKSGKPCKVYDVIVNTNTVKKCNEENEFRRFVAALCMTWIKQKSEPNLNADEFKNVNFRCKGEPQMQRIRLAHPKDSNSDNNALQDEIKLPEQKGGATAPTTMAGAGTGKLIEEVEESPTFEIKSEGSFDWSNHKQATRSPYFREKVPEKLLLDARIPKITTIKEVEVNVLVKSVQLTYVDSIKPFLTITLPFPVSEEPISAKFIRKKNLLQLVLRVHIMDEAPAGEVSKASTERPAHVCRDADELEKEAAEDEARKSEARYKENREKMDRIKREEEEVFKKRKEYVENMQAVNEGSIPPMIKEEIEKMPPEEQRIFMMRLEGRVKKGDSVDMLIDKLPPDSLDGIAAYIRTKLGLEVPKKEAPPPPKMEKPVAAAAAQPPEENVVEYNFAKKGEKMFGVKLQNRYLFALDF